MEEEKKEETKSEKINEEEEEMRKKIIWKHVLVKRPADKSETTKKDLKWNPKRLKPLPRSSYFILFYFIGL